MQRTDDVTRKEIGRNIRLARINSGLSQRTLADVLGVTRPNVSEIEAGRRDISAVWLWRLANLFSVEIAALLPEYEHAQPRCH